MYTWKSPSFYQILYCACVLGGEVSETRITVPSATCHSCPCCSRGLPLSSWLQTTWVNVISISIRFCHIFSVDISQQAETRCKFGQICLPSFGSFSLSEVRSAWSLLSLLGRGRWSRWWWCFSELPFLLVENCWKKRNYYSLLGVIKALLVFDPIPIIHFEENY